MKLSKILVLMIFLFANTCVYASLNSGDDPKTVVLRKLDFNNVMQLYNIITRDFCHSAYRTIPSRTYEKDVLRDVNYMFASKSGKKMLLSTARFYEPTVESVAGIYFPNKDDEQNYVAFTFSFIEDSENLFIFYHVNGKVDDIKIEDFIIQQIGSCLGL
jgi:hypothetical protein